MLMPMQAKRAVAAALSLVVFVLAGAPGQVAAASAADYTIVNVYPHKSRAWTEGLVIYRGKLYESTGLYGHSSLRLVDLATGSVLMKRKLPAKLFGEGLTFLNGEAWQLTWKENRVLLFDPASFAKVGRFSYKGEGWGLTTDGRYLVMSNGTSQIRFRDPATFHSVRAINVTENGQPVDRLNELEWVNGLIWANIWLLPDVVIIDPQTGNVVRRIDFSALMALEQSEGDPRDMNGIAYWKKYDRLFVTGKYWQHVYEIELNAS
jgi:glutamine cyclotransferase